MRCGRAKQGRRERQSSSGEDRSSQNQPKDRDDDVGEAGSDEGEEFRSSGHIWKNDEKQEKKRAQDSKAEGEDFHALEQQAECKVIWSELICDAKGNEQSCGGHARHPNAAIQHRARTAVEGKGGHDSYLRAKRSKSAIWR